MSDIAKLETAAAQVLLAPLNSALASIASNPTTLNVVAQFAAIQGQLIAAAPALETIGIKGVAELLQGKLAGWEASLAPAVPETPAA